MISCATILRAALVVLVLVGGVSCSQVPDRYEPPPYLEITVIPGSSLYGYDGRRITRAALEQELNYFADQGRHQATGIVRTRVRISSPKGAHDPRVKELSRWCISIGIDNIRY